MKPAYTLTAIACAALLLGWGVSSAWADSAPDDDDDSAVWYPDDSAPPPLDDGTGAILLDDDDSALPTPTVEEVEEALHLLTAGGAAWTAAVTAVLTLVIALLQWFGLLALIPEPWRSLVVLVITLVGGVVAGLASATTDVQIVSAALLGLFGAGAPMGAWFRFLRNIPPRKAEG